MAEPVWFRRVRRVEIFDEDADGRTKGPGWAWFLDLVASLFSDCAFFFAFYLYVTRGSEFGGLNWIYMAGLSASGLAVASGACYHLGQTAKAKNRLLLCLGGMAALLVIGIQHVEV